MDPLPIPSSLPVPRSCRVRVLVAAWLFAFLSAANVPGTALAEQRLTYKSAVVALAGDQSVRTELEEGLVAKAIEHNYDAITSYDLVPDVEDIDDRRFLATLAAHGVRTVLMLRPSAVGAGASLESVRDEVTPELLANMRRFAREVSPAGPESMVAVVHMAIYAISEREAELVSAGAVWLDEDVPSRAEGLERLEDLIVANIDAARPAIRERLGLPPLR